MTFEYVHVDLELFGFGQVLLELRVRRETKGRSDQVVSLLPALRVLHSQRQHIDDRRLDLLLILNLQHHHQLLEDRQAE